MSFLRPSPFLLLGFFPFRPTDRRCLSSSRRVRTFTKSPLQWGRIFRGWLEEREKISKFPEAQLTKLRGVHLLYCQAKYNLHNASDTTVRKNFMGFCWQMLRQTSCCFKRNVNKMSQIYRKIHLLWDPWVGLTWILGVPLSATFCLGWWECQFFVQLFCSIDHVQFGVVQLTWKVIFRQWIHVSAFGQSIITQPPVL